MLNATELAAVVQEETAWQETPQALKDADYLRIVVRGVRRFFVDINHPEEYSYTNWTKDEEGNTLYDREFNVIEEEYIRILCKLEFFKRVQMDANNRFGYKTDAIEITNADKPYVNLKNTIEDIEHERRIVFNKMVRYTLGE